MRRTLNIDEVAKLVHVGRTTVLYEVKHLGTACGVPVIKVGQGGGRQRVLVPVAPLLALLGLDELPDEFKEAKR